MTMLKRLPDSLGTIATDIYEALVLMIFVLVPLAVSRLLLVWTQ